MKGGLYLSKEASEAFRVPLAHFFYGVIPAWAGGDALAEPGPVSSVPDAAAGSGSPAVPGLREVVVAVVTTLAEMGLVGSTPSHRPDLPSELHPAAAPSLAPGEIAGAWAPPPRPALSGPRSAVRRAFLDMLERS